MRRQNRFVADASHELRSPLTRIRTELEVDLAQPDRADWPRRPRERCSRMTLRSSASSTTCSCSPAATPPRRPARRGRDLDDVVLDEIARPGAGPGRVDAAQVGAAASSAGTAPMFGRAVRNLLDNAERHAAATIDPVARRRRRADAVLTVEDDGAGIPAGDRAAVFDRFTRLDDARTRDAGGSGLGLAIARSAARAPSAATWWRSTPPPAPASSARSRASCPRGQGEVRGDLKGTSGSFRWRPVAGSHPRGMRTTRRISR